MELYRNSSPGEENANMFRIFTTDQAMEFTTLMLDPHVTSPGQAAPSIVRNDQHQDGDRRESEIYHRARQIYYRGKRTSARRGSGII